MKVYLVGGAVRDSLLELPVKDRDWVVVGANPDAMAADGYRQVGKDFPVFIHPESGEEYALARTERKTGKGYKGFEFYSAADVTLEEDLQRRDLTINAIAQASDGELVDPYGGVGDIAERKLRHVSPAFREDPLRVLRVARFAARFAHLGFRIADETLALMTEIVASGELEHLVAERVWQEMERALVTPNPEVFFTSLRACGGLHRVLPEVDALFGVPQPAKYHPEIDTGVHVMMCLQQAAKLSNDSVVLYATLVHDVGKALTNPDKWPSHYGHETLGLPALDAISRRLKLPTEHATIARLVCELHTKLHRLPELRAKTVLGLLMRLDAFRRPERMEKFLLSCEADSRGRTGFEDRDYPQRRVLQTLCTAAEAIDIPALIADSGPKDIPTTIHDARLAAIKQAMKSIPELQAAK